MATDHKTISDPEVHEPKDITTANAGEVYIADGASGGTWTAIDGSNVVCVDSESDFPTAVAGIITLLGSTIYVITGIISTANRFVVGNKTTVTANSIAAPSLTYTGVATMFTGVDASFVLKDIEVDAPNGKVFDISDTVGGVVRCLQENVGVVSCVKYGDFDDLSSLVITNCTSLAADDGINLSGNSWLLQSFNRFALVSTDVGFTGIDFGTAVSPTVEMDNLLLIGPAGSTGINGAANNANVTSGSIATLTNSTFAGFTTPITGIDVVNDVRWFSNFNSPIVEDTMPDALASMRNNTTTTAIAGSSTPVLVAGTWVDTRSSHYTITAAGRVTYLGEKPITVPIDIILNMEPVSGTNKLLQVQLFLNGSVILETEMSALTDAGDPLIFSTMWQLELVENDFLEVFVSNETDTVNIDVNDALFRVR